MAERKAVIKNADMSEDMQQDAVDCASQALEKYNIEKDIAAFIKKEFDKKYNPTWHCIVGRNFGSYVTHETKHFIYFYLGQVAILLAGRYRGKRVVVLNQLKSGLLLVTGPFGVNGVPLRRVNQAYCIGTSTKLGVRGMKLDKFTDAYFGRSKDQEGEKLSAERKADQNAVDKDLTKEVVKSPALKKYLRARFSLTRGMLPHELKF